MRESSVAGVISSVPNGQPQGRWLTGHAGNPPGQGPFLRVRIRVEGGVILEAGYETYQCPACHQCGKAVCEMVTGKSVVEAQAISWADVVEKVGPLPRSRKQCHGLAAVALAEALKQVESQAD